MGTVMVPASSRLTASVTGGAGGVPQLAAEGTTTSFRALDAGSYQIEQPLSAGGHVGIRRAGAELAGWDITVVANQPPTVAWAEPPGPARSDPQQLRLPWKASDDYGVTSVQAEMRLKDRPSAPPLILELPMPSGEAKAAHGCRPTGPDRASVGRAAGDRTPAGQRRRGPVRYQQRTRRSCCRSGRSTIPWRAA